VVEVVIPSVVVVTEQLLLVALLRHPDPKFFLVVRDHLDQLLFHYLL
jgi:hypothetical protein